MSATLRPLPHILGINWPCQRVQGGTQEDEVAAEDQSLLSKFVDFIKERKTVLLEEVAAEFGLRVTVSSCGDTAAAFHCHLQHDGRSAGCNQRHFAGTILGCPETVACFCFLSLLTQTDPNNLYRMSSTACRALRTWAGSRE